jgi:hypothetical protein
MQEYRINNQAFCERNFIPKMLGWYLLRTSTCLSDMEWMLARSAGFDSGFALATSLEALRKNPETGPILDALREWEKARRAGVFTPEQREALRNPKREFHLATVAGGGWDLFPFHDSADFQHEALTRQPGEPTSAAWELKNPDARQPMQLKLRAAGSWVWLSVCMRGAPFTSRPSARRRRSRRPASSRLRRRESCAESRR